MSKRSSKKSISSSQRGKTTRGSSSTLTNSHHSSVGSERSLQSDRALSLAALNDCVAKGTGKNSIPCATLSFITLCVIIHLQVFDLAILRANKGCLGLYQVFYLQVSTHIYIYVYLFCQKTTEKKQSFKIKVDDRVHMCAIASRPASCGGSSRSVLEMLP